MLKFHWTAMPSASLQPLPLRFLHPKLHRAYHSPTSHHQMHKVQVPYIVFCVVLVRKTLSGLRKQNCRQSRSDGDIGELLGIAGSLARWRMHLSRKQQVFVAFIRPGLQYWPKSPSWMAARQIDIETEIGPLCCSGNFLPVDHAERIYWL